MSKNKPKKILIALSGGIDSAVSAYLLIKQGYQVEAAFMKNWSSTAGLRLNECPWLADRQDALRVAAFLRVPLHTLDFENEYQHTVMEYFFREYKAGRTPNPDVMCNKEIKFRLLYDWAMKNGFDYLATGHYAQIAVSGKRLGRGGKPSLPPSAKRYSLLRSKDEFKDQTYFIYNIRQEQLPHLLFPVGNMKKAEVKKLAARLGLPNAGKKESMGLCFVGKIRLADFLDQKLRAKPGPIIDQDGKEIGQHTGLHYYTIGQRQGIKVGATGPYYVTRKDLKTNALHVTNNPADKSLLVKEVQIHSVNFLDEDLRLSVADSNLKSKNQNLKLAGRYRHQGELVPIRMTRLDDDRYLVNFRTPQKAVASGQSLVIYRGKTCLGGGVIS